jgi:carbamate kinase
VGGNSLITDARHQSVPDQMRAARRTCMHIAGMIERGWDVVVTHGNGPQVGFILRRSELSHHELHDVPLDSCGADTQGAIGYDIQQALYNEFRLRGLGKQAVTVVTQVRVDRDDPSFANPSKPIGGFMDEATARVRRERDRWDVVEDAGRGELVGAAAVIDKDYASALLARSIGADLLLVSTAVERVALDYNRPGERWLDRLTVTEARRFLAEGHFGKGSMAPKIEASISFLEGGGGAALITNPENIERALAGRTGTRITRE